MEIKKYQDIAELQKRAQEAVRNFLTQYKGRPLLLMMSGGSSLGIVENIFPAPVGPWVTITALDERFVTDSAGSNFAQLAATDFFARARRCGCRFFDTRPRQGETSADQAARFDAFLKKWKKEHPRGIVAATQGMGKDGHTAGIMPYPEAKSVFYRLFDRKGIWAVGYDARRKNKYPVRMTVTLPFLRGEVDYSVVYIAGDEKRDAFSRVTAETGSLHETPARILRDMKKVDVFVHTNIL